MTALPRPPTRLLSVTEYAELGESEHGCYELQEGRLLVSPGPSLDHMLAVGNLGVQLDLQLPARPTGDPACRS